MRLKLPLLLGIAAASLLIAGCKKQQDERPPVENQPVEQPKPAAPPPAPKPVTVAKPVAPKPKPAPAVAADQQVIDDADATGMTARVDRNNQSSDGAANGGNSQQ